MSSIKSMLMNRYIATLDKFRKERELHRYPTNETLGYSAMENSFIRFRRFKEESFPELLNYYCNPNVAKSIIDGGTLWLNNVRKMNDSTEMNFAIEYLSNRVKELNSSNFPPEIVKAINVSVDGLSHCKEWKETEIYGGKIVMAMCLSKLNDDAGMWERYGKSGVSIQFNSNKLSTAVTSASHFFPSSGAYEHGVAKICYEGDTCDCFQTMVSQLIEAMKIVEHQGELVLFRNLLHANLIELLMSHKNPTFQSEQEFRIYTHSPSEKNWHGTDHVYDHQVGDTTSCHSTIFLPHQALNQSEEEFWRELVSSVTFGPFIEDGDKKVVISALEKRRLSDRIVTSKCPLQRL